MNNKFQPLLLAVACTMATSSVMAADLVNMTDASLLQPMATHASATPSVDSFRVVRQIALPNGKVKVRYEQLYQGVPVFNASVVATQGASGLSEVSGMMAQNIQDDVQSVQPSMGQKEALTLAKNHYFGSTPMAGITKAQSTENENSVLMVLLDENNLAQLVYRVDFFVASEKPSRPFFFMKMLSGMAAP